MKLSDPSTPAPSSHGALTLMSNSQLVETIPIEHVRLPRCIPKRPLPEAVALWARVLKRYGQVTPLIVDDNNMVLVGFDLLEAIRHLGWKHINLVRISALTEGDRNALLLFFAKIPELSESDPQAVFAIMSAMVLEDPELIEYTGYTDPESDAVLSFDEDKTDPLDSFSPLPEDYHPVSQLGDTYKLGNNKVLCGTSLERQNLDELMAGEKAQAVEGDPPYNLKIPQHVSGKGKKTHPNFAMATGEMSFEQFCTFLESMFKAFLPHLEPGALIYIFMDRRHLEELFMAARKLNLSIQDVCIWDKCSGGMGGLYRSQHEPCAVFKWDKQSHQDNNKLGKYGRNRTNVWKHRGFSSFGKGRAEALEMHPTVKPWGLLAEIIRDCTSRGAIILDPFLGSGSTLIAAEKTGRRCFGMEIEPKYIDITIMRWEKATKKHAVHSQSGLIFAELKELRKSQAQQPHLQNEVEEGGADHDR